MKAEVEVWRRIGCAAMSSVIDKYDTNKQWAVIGVDLYSEICSI